MRRPVQLVDGKTEQLVDAELARFQSPERLVAIEEAWEQGRDWQLFKPSISNVRNRRRLHCWRR